MRAPVMHYIIAIAIGAAGVWAYYNVWPKSLGGQKGS